MSDITFKRKRTRSPVAIKFMTAVNLLFAVAVLCAWPFMAPYLDEGILRTFGEDVGGQQRLLAYPYVLLWSVPLMAVAGVIVARSFDSARAARFLAFFPAMLGMTSVLWFLLLSETYV